MNTKQELRKRCLRKTGAVLEGLDLSPYSVLLAFMPFSTEVDITPVMRLALSQGLKVAVPKTPEEFVCLDENLRPKEGDVVNPAEIKEKTLMLVPGAAFTPDGKRLGRGAGFYDRVLASIPSNVITLGICTRTGLLADIPTEEHDRRVYKVLVCLEPAF